MAIVIRQYCSFMITLLCQQPGVLGLKRAPLLVLGTCMRKLKPEHMEKGSLEDLDL